MTSFWLFLKNKFRNLKKKKGKSVNKKKNTHTHKNTKHKTQVINTTMV